MRDDREFVRLPWNHCPLAGVVADDRLGDEQGISATEGDVTGHRGAEIAAGFRQLNEA